MNSLQISKYPTDKRGDASVNAWIMPHSAANAKGHDADLYVSTILLDHKRTTRITL